MIGGVITGTLGVCAAVMAMIGGNGTPARAETSTTIGTVVSAYPTGRDRVLVGRDASLRTALLRAAVAPGDIDRIVAQNVAAGLGERLTPGTAIDIAFAGRTADDAYRSVSTASYQPRLDAAVEMARVNGQLTGRLIPVAVDHTPLRVYGTVDGDLRQSLIAAGIPDNDADAYVAALRAHVDPQTVTSGDKFDVIVEQDRAATGARHVGGLMYAGLYQANGVDLRLSQWTLGGKLQWFDATEAAQSHDNVQRPVPGVVSSNYGPRMHPILGYTRMHRGVDFKAGYGTPILAVQTGWVTKAGWSTGGFGNEVELRHGAGLSTLYAHMSQVVVAAGSLVHQGQVIGYVGATGLATGPHLHFELHLNGVPINPATVQFTVGPQLKGSDLAGYQARLAALLAVPATMAKVQMARAF